MKSEMTESDKYFKAGTHLYMNLKRELLPDYVFSKIKKLVLLEPAHEALEFGAGMGRFSSPLMSEFQHVYLVEPVADYTDILKKRFKNIDNVSIITKNVEDFLKEHNNNMPYYVFCFHLMHHLNIESRKKIYNFIKETGSVGIFVEPNPTNPLILLQILIRQDMSFGEEKEYLKLTYRRFRRELNNEGLNLAKYERLCPYPPKLIERFLAKKMTWTIKFGENILSRLLPIINSYQLIICWSQDG